MRYELDENSYVKTVTWGCSTGNCQEYLGTVPTGYNNLTEWSENAIINAYYINEKGNLTLDSEKLAKLVEQIQQETIDNALVTHKELCKTSTVVEDEFVKTVTGTRVVEINNTGEYNIPKITLVGTNINGEVQVVSSNKNLLKNDAITKEIDGITFTINNNKTITLNGTATSDIEFNLSGNSTSTEMLFLIKENTAYITSGLSQGVSLSLYNFDGTGRTLLNSGGNEIINLSMPNEVTQATLNIASGTTFDEVTISPQIEKGTNSTFYETHKSRHFITTITNNKATILNEINTYNPYTIIMINRNMDMSVDYYEYQSLVTKFSEIKATEDEITARIGTTEGNIAQLSMDVSKIRSEIGDITDITVSEEGKGTLTFININDSEPIDISIYPTGEDISYLYPSDNLYPSDDLFLKDRVLQFTNTTDGTIQTFLLPADLRCYNNIYDELSLNYDNQICQVKRRIGVNSDGSKYVLETEVVENYEYPNIYLTTGDYSITLLGYTDAYMKIRLMCQNIYTTQFATRVELNSKVTQTANEINSEVSQKVGNNEVISKINQTAETISIDANRVNIAGVINAINNNTTTTIDGDKITTGSITANQVASDVITTKNFSSQSINANNITSGTLSCDRLSGGTINGQQISGGTVSGATISSGNYFSVTASGIATLRNNVGFLTLGRSGYHPWISGINVNKTNGISFTTGTSYSSIGSSVGGINFDGSAMYIKSDGTININHGANGQIGGNVGICGYSLDGHDFVGQGGAKMYANYNCCFSPASGYYAYVGTASSTANRILTGGAGVSSLNVKENLEEINTEDVYKDIQDLKLYNYDYKYKGITDKQDDFGFIIDYVEGLPTLSKYARHYNTTYYVDEDKKELSKVWNTEEIDKTKEVLDVKEWDRDSYIKMSMVMIKALQEKIDTLESKIEELEGEK